ncbi:ABC transporter ATP-binding protein [Ramlibacter sp. RBP-2]|uniref:ABC transporter ATP-binding protein n=1 Tax=Ramlibacter lithotrophicus TaxID=2606681 RepID=A0A7X6DDJ5_9BURK|nr:ABC transporter ATP-binding protein [Ramlibacter lithotrophicus]NKE65143.1 ABC transporter ATP-binding protein [Ramlibacter lithotrophicus]
MSKLVLRNITKSFGSYTAVDNLNLTLHEGELVSLLGSSGCGKTTTLRMIAGFMTPTEGTIELDGQVISSPQSSLPPEKRQMSMIFQSYAIWPNMTVEENVAYGLKLRRISADEAKRRVSQMLDVVQLGPLRDRYPAELSGGQQQRVALARSMVVKPAILLLDEPLSNLDANLREEMRFEIRRLHDEFKMTMVYVTHDQAEAMVTSDRIAVMNKGRIEQIDAPFELYRRPKTKFVAGFIGRTNFLTGRSGGDDVDFGGFRIPVRELAPGASLPAEVQVSIRPQSIHLRRDRPAASPQFCCVEGSVQRRAYLGESWDYHITVPQSAEPIRVTARPNEVFDVGQRIYAEIDTSQITLVS